MDTFIQILLFLGFMVLMMRFGCGSHLFGKGKKDGEGKHGGCCGGGHKKHTDAAPSTDEAKKLTPPEQQIDPVCGMAVTTNEAKTSFHNGLIYFFCSETCRNTFEASPEHYVGDELPEEGLS